MEKKDKLKELLDDQHVWPSEYTFKFIVPKESEKEIEGILADHKISKNYSKNGKFLSITAKKVMGSSKEVLEVYDRVTHIKGVISL